ncbi:MAG: tetratricopeptide repeat-containing sensor histidine kinase [Fluviicola sp.]|nr:tetratricopeptide repeat-containing sensor histidine kinase [Fluviicola sp.]
MKVLLFGALFFHNFCGYSQPVSKNSLLNDQAVELSKKHELPLINKIVYFSKLKNWDSVIVNTEKIIPTVKNKTILDYLHFYRGEAFLRKEMQNQALKEFNQIKPTFDYYFKVHLYQSEIYMSNNQFDKAYIEISHIDTTNSFHTKNVNMEAVLHNIGLCYFYKGEYKKAESYLTRAINHFDSNKDKLSLIFYNTDLANVFYEQYQDDKALKYYKIAYDLAQKNGDFQTKSFTAFNMAVFKENQQKFEEALIYRKEHENWKDSLSDLNKIYEVAALEKKQAVSRKQREVKLLQTENKLKQTERNLYLIASLSLFIILVFGIYLYRQNTKRARIIFAQKQELDQLNKTKDQLFSIVSHDLRSSVYALKNSNNALLNHITTERYDEAAVQLEQNTSIATNTYNLLDNLLHWALLQTKGGYFKQELHRLGMLVDQVAYNFQSLLKEKQIEFENQLPKSCKVFIDAETIKIVLRNLMDNSIKFSDQQAKITVLLLNETPTSIQFIWRDTGRGMQEETRQKLLSNSAQLTKKEHEKEIGSGLGMNLCISMIHKNGGTLDIQSQLGIGTDFIVTLQKTGLDGAKD